MTPNADLVALMATLRERADGYRKHANGPCTDPDFWRSKATDVEWCIEQIEVSLNGSSET